MKTIMICAAVVTALAFSKTDILTGKWISPVSPQGNVTGVIFKADNTFDGFVNMKPFVSGVYTLKEDTFSFTDNGCDGKMGVYKIDFFSGKDSMRFVPITDECTERKNGMSRLVMGRVK